MSILLFLSLVIFVTIISAIGVSQVETRGIATTTISIVSPIDKEQFPGATGDEQCFQVGP